jgi:hypothetical protein
MPAYFAGFISMKYKNLIYNSQEICRTEFKGVTIKNVTITILIFIFRRQFRSWICPSSLSNSHKDGNDGGLEKANDE